MMPGLYYDMPMADYVAIDAVNISTLCEMASSPAHYRHAVAFGRTETDAMRLGSVADVLILEPRRFEQNYVVWRGGDKNKGAGSKTAWNEFQKQNAARAIIDPDEEKAALAMRTAVFAHSAARTYLTAGHSQVTLVWDLAHFRCKGRIDFEAEVGAIIDLKTSRDASPRGFGKQAASLEYHVKAAWYRDAYEQLTGKRWPFRIVAVESSAPYPVTVFRVTDEQLTLGRARYVSWLGQLEECRKTNVWAGYASGEVDLVLPRWATTEIEAES